MSDRRLEKLFNNPLSSFGLNEALLIYRGILPIIESIGWDRYDKVVTEFQIPTFATKSGNRSSTAADIVCCNDSGVYFVVEAKFWAKPLKSEDFEQIKKYCRALNPPVGILTNGEEWYIYKSQSYDACDRKLETADFQKFFDELQLILSPEKLSSSAFPYEDALEMGMSNRNRARISRDASDRVSGTTVAVAPFSDNFRDRLDEILDKYSPDLFVAMGESSYMLKIRVADHMIATILEFQPDNLRLAFRGHELMTKLGFSKSELEKYEADTRKLNTDFASTDNQQTFLDNFEILVKEAIARIANV
ncbi:MAG: hypothetical protein EP341_07985 [Sphingomonadales bacterium]|nr:MAG: hypothetical protein EP341_07985 [Sphingomonadales bacterium]